jgi:hypothetical protein
MRITSLLPPLPRGQFDLLELLPSSVAERIDLDMVAYRPTAAALRVLATITDPRVWVHVGPARIDWDALVALTGVVDEGTQHLIRVAQSLGDGDLREAAERLGDGEYAALVDAMTDAMRIASPGGAW